MSLFVDNNELIEGEIFYVIKENNAGKTRPIILLTDLEIKRYKDEVQSFKIFFRQENYALSSQIVRDSVVIQPDGSVVLHPVVMGEAQIKRLLTKWTLKDEETGKPIPINDQTINSLHPDVARAILVEYRRLNSYNFEGENDISEFLSEDYDEERLQEILSERGVKVTNKKNEEVSESISKENPKEIEKNEKTKIKEKNGDNINDDLKTSKIEE